MKKIVLYILCILTLIFVSSCKKYKYDKCEIKITSSFNANANFIVKCRGIAKSHSNKEQRKLPYTILKTDLELNDLKNRTNAELYSMTNDQLTFFKDGAFFYIRSMEQTDNGTNTYYLNYDYCLVIDKGPYGFNSFSIKTPFPSFLLNLETTQYDEKHPIYCIDFTRIDYKNKEYIIEYYKKISYDWVKINDDSIILSIIDYTNNKKWEVIIDLVNEIKISAKEQPL